MFRKTRMFEEWWYWLVVRCLFIYQSEVYLLRVRHEGKIQILYFAHLVTRSKREIPRLKVSVFKVTGLINAHHVHERAVTQRIDIPSAISPFDFQNELLISRISTRDSTLNAYLADSYHFLWFHNEFHLNGPCNPKNWENCDISTQRPIRILIISRESCA